MVNDTIFVTKGYRPFGLYPLHLIRKGIYIYENIGTESGRTLEKNDRA